jgi:murein L,D-transpeptidase YafK
LAGALGLMSGAASAAPPLAPPDERADAVYLDKSERRLDLLRDGAVIQSYEVSLGANPEGHKEREGDERTPTGTYVLDWRNPDSRAHLALHVSYPDADDIARARALGVSPGGDIMIHGIANGWGWVGPLHRLWDWTDGCIAVTNAEMREIWSLVPDGTPITIEE